MMLRGNLATRPFYNERLVAVLLALVAVIALALSVFNVTRLLQLSSRRTELRAQISADEAEAARIRQSAVAVQNSVDRASLMSLAGSAREANGLIDARTFSWTTFFGYIEDTIPMGVRLTAVSPEIEKGTIVVTMLLLGRQAEDIAAFMTAIEETGAFYDASPTAAGRTEDGLQRVSVRVSYAPPPAAPEPTPTPTAAPAAGGGR